MNGGLDGYAVDAPPLPRPVAFDQFWADLTFVHRPVHPAAVAHLFPPGTCPDVFADGLTYVALVPFVMRHTRVGTALPLGYFGSFAETNVRLYSVDDAGRHGVLFRSLEDAAAGRASGDQDRHGGAVCVGEDARRTVGRPGLLRQRPALAAPGSAQPDDGAGGRARRTDTAGDLADRPVGPRTPASSGARWAHVVDAQRARHLAAAGRPG